MPVRARAQADDFDMDRELAYEEEIQREEAAAAEQRKGRPQLHGQDNASPNVRERAEQDDVRGHGHPSDAMDDEVFDKDEAEGGDDEDIDEDAFAFDPWPWQRK
eukprot:5936925-Prymnesium_polylepis.1